LPRPKSPKKQKPDIVSVHLAPESKARLDQVCEKRGMTIKRLLGRLIEWFVDLDRTEQSIVLGLVEDDDIVGLAEMVLARRNGSRLYARGRRRR